MYLEMLSNFRKNFAALLASSALVVSLIVPASAAAPAARDAKGNDIVPNELIVKFKATATDAEIQHGLKLGHLKVKKHLQTPEMKARGHNGVTLVETDLAVDDAVAQLKNHPAVDYVEPNYTYKHQFVSNDNYVTANYTWGLYSALSSPANTYGSGAMDAWTAGYTGTNSVYVAVIDEGIDYSHPELSGNMFNNPFDPPDGIDNDGNGYIDDVHGWNFYGGNNQVFDSTGDDHGTHVSGTIGARGGNGAGVAGVNWNVTILSGKFLGANGGDTLSAVEAIDYFVDMKKRHNLNLVAINASWGGGGYSQSLHDAIIRAAKAGIIFCAAAGNDSLNNDTSASYPSNIDTRKGTSTETAASFDSVIAVAALDSTGGLASFSNYGAKTVHIGAPGVQILSTFPGGQYGYMSGTSMATPHVTGAVALYASTHPGASAQPIRDAIIGAVTPTVSLAGKTTTGGRLNISSIIKPVASTPAAPTGLAATASAGSVKLTWNAAAGATSYVVKRSATVGGPYTTVATVTTTAYTDSTVSNGTQYFYVVAAVSSGGTSLNSIEVSATPQAAVTVPAPSDVTATAAQTFVSGAGNVTVRWTAVPGATSYQIKRASSAAGPWALYGNIAATTFTQTVTANNNNTYYYRIVSMNGTTTGGESATASVTTIPASPVNLTSKAISSSELQLAWSDRSADEQGFKIEYWNGTAWVQIGTTGSNVNTVNITGTSSGGTYSFRVRAYNGTLNTPYSNYTTIKMP
jgi:subtilisin family serine protease